VSSSKSEKKTFFFRKTFKGTLGCPRDREKEAVFEERTSTSPQEVVCVG